MADQHLESFHTVVLGCIMERRLKVVECTNVHVRYGRSRKNDLECLINGERLSNSPAYLPHSRSLTFSVFNLSTVEPLKRTSIKTDTSLRRTLPHVPAERVCSS